MVAETGKRLLVESDFLLGLRKSDKHHSRVMRLLGMHSSEEIIVNILSSAVLEVKSVLYSQGIRSETVEESLSLMDQILLDYGVNEYVALTLSDAVLAENMKSEFTQLTFFDSLHAAAAKRLGLLIVSSDPIYRKIGIPSLGFYELK